MSICNKFIFFCFCAMLVGSVLIGDTNANKVIGKGAMAANRELPCKGGNCLPQPSNPENRGCETIERCRHS
ncbi:Uncharacterized protein TCM_012643 [Theobroma cacao]|uniref:Rapid ALkalinization Factor n=1 Tax=Theobroma cacao TaxID=3641 RepID=A0A061FVZ5_THECC|nr:Uncharacterized protein TCM_012643 [Theobroma cacao]